MAGKVIILNGASSAGKSSIAKKMQGKLNEDYFLTGVDNFMERMPIGFVHVEKIIPKDSSNIGVVFKWKNDAVHEIQMNEKGYALINAMYASISTLVANDINVIVDDVIINTKVQELCFRHLSKYNPTIIGIYCIPEIRHKREVFRGDRMPGLYKAHENFIYTQMKYSFLIDNTSNTVTQSVNSIIKKLNKK